MGRWHSSANDALSRVTLEVISFLKAILGSPLVLVNDEADNHSVVVTALISLST